MKDSGSTKESSRRLSKEDIKKRIMESLVYNESINTEDLNERAYKAESYEEVMVIIKEYEDTIKTNKKNLIFFAYQEGKSFLKI